MGSISQRTLKTIQKALETIRTTQNASQPIKQLLVLDDIGWYWVVLDGSGKLESRNWNTWKAWKACGKCFWNCYLPKIIDQLINSSTTKNEWMISGSWLKAHASRLMAQRSWPRRTTWREGPGPAMRTELWWDSSTQRFEAILINLEHAPSPCGDHPTRQPDPSHHQYILHTWTCLDPRSKR